MLVRCLQHTVLKLGFSGGSDSKVPSCNVGDQGTIPGSGRSPGEGKCNLFQYSCLENPMARGVEYGTPWDPKELDMTE